MNITSARFIDPKHTAVEAIIDGVLTQEVGGGFGDPRIREWIALGNKPAAYVAPPPEPVKTKSQRLAALLAANGLTLADLKAEITK